MNVIYLAPTTVIPPLGVGSHQALRCPSDGTLTLLVVSEWMTDEAQDAFEARPDVRRLDPWQANDPVPASLVNAFKSGVASVSALDTIGTALWKIRAAWPAARH